MFYSDPHYPIHPERNAAPTKRFSLFYPALADGFSSPILVCVGILLEETTCYMEKNGTEGNITRGEIDEDLVQLTAAHSIDLDCLWLIEVEPGWKVNICSDCLYLIRTMIP